jgi:hypothetical protein
MIPEAGRNIDAMRLSVLPFSIFFSGSGRITFVRGVLLGLCGFAGAGMIDGAGVGRVGTSGAGLVGTLATNSTDVQVVAASTGLLINGRAVDPGFGGGNAGVAELVSLMLELNRLLLCGRLHFCTGFATFVFIATVGIQPGGGGAGFVGSASLD